MAGDAASMEAALHALVSELVVEVSNVWEHDLALRIHDFIKDNKKHNTLWKRFIRWLGSIKRFRCLCGVEGSSCECERTPPVLRPNTTATGLVVRPRAPPPVSE